MKNAADDHGGVRALLKGRKRRGDAERLDRLRQWRNEADYVNRLEWIDINQFAQEAIKEAEKVIKSLEPPIIVPTETDGN